jgi:hypothetical protein
MINNNYMMALWDDFYSPDVTIAHFVLDDGWEDN